MLFVISYDITNDRRCTKIARTLEGFGQRVQYSVFECDLTDRQYEVLRRKLLKRLAAQEGDSLRVYRLCKTCVQGIALYGAGPPVEQSVDVLVV
jgi:CRISPR-associated protein Cas2